MPIDKLVYILDVASFKAKHNGVNMLSPNIKLIPSYIQSNKLSTEKTVPYLFFHIPKSAGMSLFIGLGSGFHHGKDRLSFPYIVSRIDDEKKDLEVLSSLTEFFVKSESQEVGGIIASHIPNKVLNAANTPFKFITVLRDPISRVMSAFTYDCMRNDIMPTSVLLNDFVKKESNQNIMTKTLLGINKIQGGEGVISAKMVKNNFYAYCFVSDLNELIESLITESGLPNIALGSENQTLEKFKYTGSEEDRLLIASMNKEDVDLVNEIGSGSKNIPAYEKTSNISDRTVKVMGDQTSSKYNGESALYKTEDLLKSVV